MSNAAGRAACAEPQAEPETQAQATNVAGQLDAWRVQGADRFDPVRFRLIDALARRAATHAGPARCLLDERLDALLAAYREDLERSRAGGGACGGPAPGKAGGRPSGPTPIARRGPLAELLDHLARHASAQPPDPPAPLDAVHGLSGLPELKALRHFQSTWSRLNAGRQLTQSRAKVPKNAGPLNSHQLVHRALQLMHELSPDYLHRFMAYVDALLWLDQTDNGPAAGAATAPAERPPRKPVRGSRSR